MRTSNAECGATVASAANPASGEKAATDEKRKGATDSLPPQAADALALPDAIRLRPIADADLPFLERVYASTRTTELAQTDWSEEQKASFLGFQFRAQHQHYLAHYHGALYFVVEQAGVPVGRLYLHWRADDLRIMEIALLPEARGQALGRTLLAALMARAALDGRSVSIHVEQMNPAMRLYLRLGFRKIGEHGIYHLMEWRPDAS
jgi:ribosomal protein S18 acetylase RimI-like enzyme